MSEDVHRRPPPDRADTSGDPTQDALEQRPASSNAFRLWTLVGGLVAFALLVQLLLY